MMKTQTRANGYGAEDVGDIAMAMGLGRTLATMVIPYMWESPRVSDPYSPSVLEIVKGLQSGLAKLGYATRRDGFVDRGTVAAITEISGPTWKSKPWVEIYSDVLFLIRNGGGRRRPGILAGLGGVFEDLFNPSKWTGSTSSTSSSSTNRAFTVSGDVCKPNNATTLEQFKRIQRQINRLHALWKFKLITVDGRPGPITTKALNSIFKAANMSTQVASCAEYAEHASETADLVSTLADAAGAPSSVADPKSITSPPSIVSPDGQVVHPAIATANMDKYIGQATKFASSPIGLALVAGGVFFFLKRRGGGKAKRTSRRPARARRRPRARRRRR